MTNGLSEGDAAKLRSACAQSGPCSDNGDGCTCSAGELEARRHRLPGGLSEVGLSDERLREMIDSAQSYIGANGYDPDPEHVIALCRELLSRRSLPGSDAGEPVAWRHNLTGIIRQDKPYLGLHEDYTPLYASPSSPADEAAATIDALDEFGAPGYGSLADEEEHEFSVIERIRAFGMKYAATSRELGEALYASPDEAQGMVTDEMVEAAARALHQEAFVNDSMADEVWEEYADQRRCMARAALAAALTGHKP